MLFRDFKTGLAIGLTALLFSSGAVAATIGGAPMDDPRTPDENEKNRLGRLTTTIATEIFGGSARDNRTMEFMVPADKVWLLLEDTIRYPIDIDLMIGGAEFANEAVSGDPMQRGYVIYDSEATTMTAIPLFKNVATTGDPDLEPVTAGDIRAFFGTDEMKTAADINSATTIMTLNADGTAVVALSLTATDSAGDAVQYMASDFVSTLSPVRTNGTD